jgi:hypothetical protein
MKNLKWVLVISFWLMVLTAMGSGGVPDKISYEGRLTDTAGNPITAAKNISFKIFDAAIAGNIVWPGEEISVTPDGQGVFSVILGKSTPLTAAVFSGPVRYIEIAVAGETITPRTQIVSVGYAFMAATAQSVEDGSITRPKVAANQFVKQIIAGAGIGLTSDEDNGTGKVTLTATAPPVSGANTELSNLSQVTQVNSSLLPGTSNLIDLGSLDKNWRSLYLGTSLVFKAANNNTITITPNAPSANRTLEFQDKSGKIVVAASGNIKNEDIDPNAGITDDRLAQINTANKVKGAAIASLADVPPAAGKIPNANLNAGTGPNQLVATDGAGKLPVVDGSQLTNVPATVLDGSITEPKLAPGAVTPTKVAAGNYSINVSGNATSADNATNAANATKFNNQESSFYLNRANQNGTQSWNTIDTTVDKVNLATQSTGTIGNARIEDGAVTNAKLGANAVDNTKVAAGNYSIDISGNAATANTATSALTANNAVTATTANTANTATNANHANTADSATTATTANTATNATKFNDKEYNTLFDVNGKALNAVAAETAVTATTANTANSALTANTAVNATTANTATNADNAANLGGKSYDTLFDATGNARTSLQANNANTAVAATTATTANNALNIADGIVTSTKLAAGAVDLTDNIKVVGNLPIDTRTSGNLNIGTRTTGVVGAARIEDGAITNTKIAADAAIATNKLTGPVTAIPSHGLGSLATKSTVANADIDAAAGIDKSKLAALNIGDADIAVGAAISKSKLAALNIGNADIAAGAAIEKTKLAALNIGDADIAAGASISKSKLAALNIGNGDIAADAAIVTTKLTGPVTAIPSHGLGTLATKSTVANADIGAAAGIDKSKLAALNIGDADIATGASISKSKLAALNIVNADIDPTAAIATTKLTGPVTAIPSHGLGSLATKSTVANADIDAGAGIDKSKLAALNIVNADIDPTAAIATTKLTGPVTAIPSHGLGSLATKSTVEIGRASCRERVYSYV